MDDNEVKIFSLGQSWHPFRHSCKSSTKTVGRHISQHIIRIAGFIFCSFLVILYLVTQEYQQDTTCTRPLRKSILQYQWNNETSQECQRLNFTCKIIQAQESFTRVQHRQSKTLVEARLEYQKRYKRLPPLGFNKWVQYALSNDAVLIDEYDRIELDLTPFRKAKISRNRMIQRMANAIKADSLIGVNVDLLGFVHIKDGNATYGGREKGSMSVPVIQKLLAPVIADIPDVIALHNYFSGPRILATLSEKRSQQDDDNDDDSVMFSNYRRRSTWDIVTEACQHKDDIANRAQWARASSATELCNYPFSRIKDSHGFFVAPNDFYPTDTLIPLMSNAKVSTMNDLLVPNLCYGSEEYRKFKVQDSIPFDKKQKSIYWRGSTTGLYSTQDNWHTGHRQRFVAMTKWMNQTAESIKRIDYNTIKAGALTKDAKVKALDVLFHDESVNIVSQLPTNAIDVAFMANFNCEQLGCWEIEQNLPFTRKEESSREHDMQLLGDIDGEGISCRFYRFLNSNSLPIKQTIYAEWHDERLKPWIHYVPLSMEMLELPHLLHWLLNTDKGQKAAAEMAQNGKDWSNRVLRPIDITLYYYRLLIELASIYPK